jgi:cysteine desulfurase/selenocysteine lyase
MNEDTHLIYMDNGATSFPKPPAVSQAMLHFLSKVGGSPGRSGHRLSQEAARTVFDCRESLAALFAVPDSRRIAFTLNATEALNTALLGLLREGDGVVTTAMEHNSVMRPLRELVRSRGIALHVVPCDDSGRLDLDELERALQKGPRLVAVNHASNVTGAVVPLEKIGSLAKSAGALMLVDAAQSAGVIPIDVVRDGVDILAFTGHKGLLGPQGTGGLWVREGVEVAPLCRGGTGSNSELEEQPDFYPDRLESGTQNAVGLAGLRAGVEFLRATGVDVIAGHERSLAARLLEGLGALRGVVLHGPPAGDGRTSVVSFTIPGMAPSETGFLLDEAFGVLTRVGLHCAPGAHRTIGTYPEGTVRLSPGYFTTPGEIEKVIEAVAYVAAKKGGGRG